MIYGYKKGSASVKALSQATGLKVIKHEGSKFKGSPDKLVINWGASKVSEEVGKCAILNIPEAVKLASNKLKFFEAVKGDLNIPEYTTDRKVAEAWSEAGSVVVGRTVLNGHSAQGLFIIEQGEWDRYEDKAFQLYVKYIPKKEEYRVHVVGGEVVDVRRKALRNGYPKKHACWKVRNYDNGFIYAKEGFEAPEEVLSQSVKAVELVGLDFGAVDVIWNSFYNKAYVLEVNTAAGLEGSTINNYAEGFAKLYIKCGHEEKADRMNSVLADFVAAMAAEKELKKASPVNPDIPTLDGPDDVEWVAVEDLVEPPYNPVPYAEH